MSEFKIYAVAIVKFVQVYDTLTLEQKVKVAVADAVYQLNEQPNSSHLAAVYRVDESYLDKTVLQDLMDQKLTPTNLVGIAKFNRSTKVEIV